RVRVLARQPAQADDLPQRDVRAAELRRGESTDRNRERRRQRCRSRVQVRLHLRREREPDEADRTTPSTEQRCGTDAVRLRPVEQADGRHLSERFSRCLYVRGEWQPADRNRNESDYTNATQQKLLLRSPEPAAADRKWC